MRTATEPLRLVAVWAVGTVLGTSAHAMQPSAVKLAFENVAASGTATLLPTVGGYDTAVTLVVENPRRDVPLVVGFPACTTAPVAEGLVLVPDLEAALEARERPADARPFRPAPGWQVCARDGSATPGRYLIAPQERRRISFGVDFRTAGRHHVLLNAEIFVEPAGGEFRTNAGLEPIARQPIGLSYEVRGSGERAAFRHVTNEEIAGMTRLPRAEHEGFSSEIYRDGVHPVDLDTYLKPRRLVPAAPYDPSHADLRQVLGGTGDEAPAEEPVFTPMGGSGSGPIEPGTPFIIKGRFSVKIYDGYGGLRPAWGWQIIAWWDDDGDWVELGRSIVTSDGSYWFVVWHEDYYGQNLKVQVRAWSPFFKVVNQDGSLYRYNNPLRTNIGLTQDEGHRWVDAEAKGIPGIYGLFYRGYELYDEMYFRAKINPIRDQPVRVYYPNTWEDCGVGEIWSCADRDGRVWITEDSANGDTIQHELGHQMNYEFWDNKLPANSSGAHDLTDCIPRGQALVEGYADFVPYWVQADRANGPSEVESPGSSYCNSPGKRNEQRVAATLWDMYDTEKDGDDLIYFTKQGAVHSMFFNNGVATDGAAWGIDDLRVPYRNQASAPHRTIIDDIFAQNGTD